MIIPSLVDHDTERCEACQLGLCGPSQPEENSQPIFMERKIRRFNVADNQDLPAQDFKKKIQKGNREQSKMKRRPVKKRYEDYDD